MHAASVVLLTWTIIGAACFFPSLSATALAVALAFLVAFVGLPHGAADHLFAKPRLERLCGSLWAVVFLVSYLAVAAAVVAGWFFFPAVTAVGFFLMSAWHFGQEEPRLAIGPRVVQPLLRFARGGLVIWIPMVAHTADVVRTLGVIMPGEDESSVLIVMPWLRLFSFMMIAVASLGWGLELVCAAHASGRRRRGLMLDVAVVGSLVVLFTVTSPLVSFPVFFCGWHSIRGLRRLRRERSETWPQLVYGLAGMTVASLALIATAAWLLFQADSMDDTLVRTTFIGLSSLAVPHLVLHGFAPRLDVMARRRLPPGLLLGGAR